MWKGLLCNTHYQSKVTSITSNMWLLPILVLLVWSMPLTLSSKSAKLLKLPKLLIYETPFYHDTSKSSKTATVKAAISPKRLFSTTKSASKSFKHDTRPTANNTDNTPTDELTDIPTKAPATEEPTRDEPTYEETSVIIIEDNFVPTLEPTSSPETPATTVSIHESWYIGFFRFHILTFSHSCCILLAVAMW